MEPFEEEEKEREKLESRLHEFRKSRQPSGEFTAWKGLYLAGSLGFAVAASLLIGILLGSTLDSRWGTKPWLTLTGLFLGLAGGAKIGYELVRSVLKK